MSRLARPAALLAFAAGSLSPLLAVASPEAHGDGHGGGIQWISPVFGGEGKLGLVWILINFAVLFWLLNKLLIQPLVKRTATKHDEVKSEIDKATAAREEAESALAEVKSRLDGLDDEIDELMKDAKAKAEADRKRIIADAERDAKAIRAAAKAAGEREAAARLRRLEGEIVDRAVARAEQVLRSTMTPADQRGMVDRYVDQLGQVDFGGR